MIALIKKAAQHYKTYGHVLGSRVCDISPHPIKLPKVSHGRS